MSAGAQARFLTAAELDGVLDQAGQEEWTELMIVSADRYRSLQRREPEKLSGKQPLVLTEAAGEWSRRLVTLPSLRSLTLSGVGLDARDASVLTRQLQGLTFLDISHNRIGEPGAVALAQNLQSLTTLGIGGNGIGDQGAVALAENLHSLTTLSIGGNGIGDQGAVAIAENLQSLTTLNVGYNSIGEQGAVALAKHLQSLTTLDISHNDIGDQGAVALAENLHSLTALYIGYNSIGEPGAVALAQRLRSLTTLDISNNGLGEPGAVALAQNLHSLTSLEISLNGIGEPGAVVLAENLRSLTSLNISDNGIRERGAVSLAKHLQSLSTLDISGNGIGEQGAVSLAKHLQSLSTLDISGNGIGERGAVSLAKHLQSLSTLNISGNGIGERGAVALAKNLHSLNSLAISSNGLGNESIAAVGRHLPHLHRLYVSGNPRLSQVAALVQRPALEYLELNGTGVKDLSPLKDWVLSGTDVFAKLAGTGGIYVNECPLTHPTQEVVAQGPEAVRNYFRELEQQGEAKLYEAKVLILGEGGAGKTSLLRRLYQRELPLPEEKESTKGIEVHQHEFERTAASSGGRKASNDDDGSSSNGGGSGRFRLNVWDFGGQEIYHATHQFFLTKNSLYVLVDDTRTDHKTVRDAGFKYWLEVVETLSRRCPLFIFQNEKGGRSKRIDEGGIKGRFPNVLGVYRGDLEDPEAAEGLRQAIEFQAQRLPHVGEDVPRLWVKVRAAIEERARKTPYLTQQQYFDIYAEYLDFDRDKALLLSRYLHDLGAFLHFQEDLRLCGTVIIQNRWATEAVFKLLDDEVIKQQLGHFSAADCQRLWQSSEYADMHGQLLALMENFELCYPLRDGMPQSWLAPQLLSPSSPTELEDWAGTEDLVLNYSYDFLPKGLISRLMVRMHHLVCRPQLCWVTGALFEREGTQLLVQVSADGREIELRARGAESRALLTVISADLDALNSSFHGLESKVHKRVPCNCTQCATAAEPALFEEKKLKQRKENGKWTIECPESYQDVQVLQLLDGLKPDTLPSWAAPPPPPPTPDTRACPPAAAESSVIDPSVAPSALNGGPRAAAPGKTVKVFLAPSAEMAQERNAFDLYCRQQNDWLHKRGVSLEIVRWEHFLDAMAKTRLQDEYNRAVRDADLFVSLFQTKTGKFTEEEFDVAYRAFLDNGSPHVFTFFKQVQVSNSAEHRPALTSLWNFRERLENLGHYPTEYENTAELHQSFRKQLEELYPQI